MSKLVDLVARRARKAAVAVAGAVVAWAGTRYGIDSPAYSDIVAVLTAVGVYVVPNR